MWQGPSFHTPTHVAAPDTPSVANR